MSKLQIAHQRGIIVLSRDNEILFLFGLEYDLAILRDFGFQHVATGATVKSFGKFIEFCEKCKILENRINHAKCDRNTLKLLYDEFFEIDFNLGLAALLKSNGIDREMIHIESLDYTVANEMAMPRLLKTRRWLKAQLARVFTDKKGPQLPNYRPDK